MQLVFPHLELLQYCLQSGVIPKHMSSSKVSTGALQQRPFVVAPARKPSKKTLEQLKNLGVSVTYGESLDEQFDTWFELLPLVEDETDVSEYCRGTMVFQLTRREHLADLIGELLRLGNDRIGLRYSKVGGSIIAFARVENPPFYTVLRAMENASESAPTIIAYREQVPRVWVQVGYRYGLAELLKPAEGTEILLRHGRRMRFLEQAPYSDVYQSIDVTARQQSLTAHEFEQRFEIPLRLLDADPTEASTLWLLQKNPVKQIEDMLLATGDRYIDQLSFAALDLNDSMAVVLRAKKTRSSTLVANPDGLGFHSYMKIPQLFIPNGMRLSPPMRRDFVAKLFVPDGEHITLLLPDEPSKDASGGFLSCRIAEEAFRPLRLWSDFVLEQEIEVLEEWAERHTFDFEEFVTDIAPDQEATKRPQVKKRRSKATAKPKTNASTQRTPPAEDQHRPAQPDFEPANDPIPFEPQPVGRISDDWDELIEKLESEFRGLTEPVDGPSRSSLWMQLGNAYLKRNRQRDGTVCFSNAMWLAKADDQELSERWLEGEVGCTEFELKNEQTLEWLLAQAVSPSVIVAYINLLAAKNNKVETQAISAASQFLRANESVLPIRTTWLGWCSLSKLSGGDALMLAQARDRLLRQLHESGLRADFDLPGFLRLSGRADASRRGHIEEGIGGLQQRAEQWVVEPDSILHDSIRATRQYAQLTFAYAYARIGQSDKAREVMAGAIADLPDDSEVHRWLAAAYQERIENTIHGRNDSGPSADLLDAIRKLPKYDANVVNQLRAISRIIDPDLGMDDLFWHDEQGLKAQQRQLFLTADSALLREQVELLEREVRNDSKRTPQSEAEALVTILAVAPRLDAPTATRVLSRVSALADANKGADWPKCATLLERGICVAGHFGILSLVREFHETLKRLLPDLVHATISSASVRGQGKETNKIKLFHESYSRMRRLGLDDELRQLLQVAWKAVGKFKAPKKRPGANPEGSRARALGIKLHVATGWQYLGDSQRTDEVLDEAKQLVFQSPLDLVSRTELIRNYAFLIGNCQLDDHIDRLVELLEFESDNRRKIDHHKRFVDESIISARLCSKQFQVIEAVVLALLGECTLNPESQKWLDEEEFLVRKKIHQDVESLV